MHGRVDRAHALARSAFAMLAKHWLEHDLGIVGRGLRVGRRAAEITVDAKPVHLAAAADLLLADDRDVVLALAGDHASAATNAAGQINGHAPLMLNALQSRLGRVGMLIDGTR